MLKPMLCKDDLPKFVKHVGSLKNSYWSIKKDGVRCIADPIDRTYTSRNGKLFPNFHVFNDDLTTLAEYISQKYDIVPCFDGEVVSKVSGFQKLMTQVRRLKEVDPSIFRFEVFDIAVEGLPFHERYSILCDAFRAVGSKLENTSLLVHHESHFETEQEVIEHVEWLVEVCGEEGIVLKSRDGLYEGKKSIEWCKVKKFETVDLNVTGVQPGTGKHKGRMGALLCNYEGHEVKVGTGFSDVEREEFMERPPAMIEVKFQEKTKAGSLRFPAFIRVREDK
jgi:DNA ligase-1